MIELLFLLFFSFMHCKVLFNSVRRNRDIVCCAFYKNSPPSPHPPPHTFCVWGWVEFEEEEEEYKEGGLD